MALNSLCKRARELRTESPGSCAFFRNIDENITPDGTSWN